MTAARGMDGSSIDTRAHGDPATIADLIDVVRDLIGAINAKNARIDAVCETSALLADSVGALAQCVAMAMEEELGTPVADEPKRVETDWDGNPIG